MTSRMIVVAVAAAALAGMPLPAHAQQTSDPQSGGPQPFSPRVKSGARSIVNILSNPLHPTVKGVASGGGLGIGVGYDEDFTDAWEVGAKAVYTLKGFWSAEASTGLYGDQGELELYGRMRDMKQLNFFGLGTESLESARTNFRLRDQSIGVRGKYIATPWLSVGGRVENLLPRVRSGTATSRPSIEERFSDAEAPGLAVQSRFNRYEGMLELHLPAGLGESFFQGASYRATYAQFDDLDADIFNFARIDLEARHQFASFIPLHRLTLHGWVSTTETDAGNAVPFYLQRTLGGRSNLRTVGEDFLGSDGTQASLRGYRSYRFRDKHLLLLQAEYRFPVYGPIEATLFGDAGKVTSTRDELDFSNLKHDYGFSIALMHTTVSMLRFDVAFGSGEGTRFLISVGRDILP